MFKEKKILEVISEIDKKLSTLIILTKSKKIKEKMEDK